MSVNISDVKPGGGGDFTTLQLFHDWAAVQAGPVVQQARCFTGGDLGQITFTSWTENGSVGEPRKIYTEPGDERPTGADDSSGAYISIPNGGGTGIVIPAGVGDNITIQGIRIEYESGGSTGQGLVQAKDCNNLVLDAITGVHNATNKGLQMILDTGITVTGVQISNCMLYGKDHPRFMIRILSTHGSANLTISVFNNIMSRTTSGGAGQGVGISIQETSGTINCTRTNNISVGNATLDYYDVSGPSITASYDASSDASADDAGGSHHELSITVADWVTNELSDLRPPTPSSTQNTGATIAAVTTDILGTSRPQGASYDRGAFEIEEGWSGSVNTVSSPAAVNSATSLASVSGVA